MTNTERTAVVTGSAGGIGRAIARQLAADGCHVVIIDVVDGTDTVELIEGDGGTAEYREGDVTDEESIERVFDGLDVDVLINNAAIYGPLVENKRRFDEIDIEEWQQVLDVNVTGVFLTTKAALPHLREGASIVNIGSNSIELGVPGFLHYIASKGAVLSMTRSLATELGSENIRVNAIMPGLTMTEATLQNDDDYIDDLVSQQAIERPLEPEDVANGAAFLASPESAPMSGQVLSMDPGQAFY